MLSQTTTTMPAFGSLNMRLHTKKQQRTYETNSHETNSPNLHPTNQLHDTTTDQLHRPHRLEYTLSHNNNLLLALSDLAAATHVDTHELLAALKHTVDARVAHQLETQNAATAEWIRKDREVWELQRWQPFVGWGSRFPGHLYPWESRWVRRDLSR